MPVKNLKNAYVRVTVETKEQMIAAAETPAVDLIIIDAGLFRPETWKECTGMIHKGSGGLGKLSGLRLPQVWRSKTESFFRKNEKYWKESGFDLYLARNPEEILWLTEEGIDPEKIAVDHTVYIFNNKSDDFLFSLTGILPSSIAYCLELNIHELRELSLKRKNEESAPACELTVYGRAPLMVTAQCLRKTSIGCDRRMSLLWMKDRTGAMMPVRNCCTFCCNTIYNSMPTVLFDLTEEINSVSPDCIRYEFTSENAGEVKSILRNTVPERFTRGHFKRGVL